VFDESKSARISAETELMESLISILDKLYNDSFEAHTSEHTRSNYAQIIKVVEAYALANVDRRLYVSELCQIVGVSERTLQGAFHEIMQMSPITYLNRLRLHRARTSLRSASTSTTTVSAVALDWGFWHFGRFSRAYKQCFQEAPSKTLARKAEAVKDV
jgi:AraC family ethanolamine operon transcriptional activator